MGTRLFMPYCDKGNQKWSQCGPNLGLANFGNNSWIPRDSGPWGQTLRSGLQVSLLPVGFKGHCPATTSSLVPDNSRDRILNWIECKLLSFGPEKRMVLLVISHHWPALRHCGASPPQNSGFQGSSSPGSLRELIYYYHIDMWIP